MSQAAETGVTKPKKPYTLGEEIFNSVTHGVGALLSIAGTVLVAVIASVIVALVRNKRKGKSSCGCQCEHCAMAGSCRSKKE